MDRRVWSKLPAELLDLSLSFLPLMDVCRFRVVCRRWKNLLSSPDFGKLFVVNTTRGANEPACLVVNRQVEGLSGTRESRWSVVNLRERKWYDLKLDLPSCGCISTMMCDCLYDMDGGFVCTTVVGWMGQQRSNPMLKRKYLIVFNPFGGAVKVLPDPPSDHDGKLFLFEKKLKLVVDSNSNTFKVLLIITDCRYRGGFPFCIYESSTDQWTTAPMPPYEAHDGRLILGVVFQGLLYCCLKYWGFEHGGMLWSFNLLDGSWEDTGVQFPDVGFHWLDLAVTDNRLFLTKVFGKGSDLLYGVSENLVLEISEIMIADKMISTVVQTTYSAVFPLGPKKKTRYREISAFGLDKSKLLLHSSRGEVVMYDLASGEWESFPPNPLDNAFHLNQIRAGRMEYCFPYTPW